MRSSLLIFGAFFIVSTGLKIYSQDSQPVTIMPGMRGRALVLNIDARVLDVKKTVIWNETNQRLTISGTPVGIKMVGANLAILIQLTPFIHRNGQKILVAQGQIWIDVPDKGISYYTSIRTIPIEFNEPVYFLPLGDANPAEASIEIMLTLNPYKENEAAETAKKVNEN